jgi:hypothetical protein
MEMAAQWHLIGNAEPLIGRTAEASDPRGAALVASRLVRLMMQLCFLQERRYWPYAKWFGTAFSRLDAAPAFGPLLDAVLAARDHPAREVEEFKKFWSSSFDQLDGLLEELKKS